jgi:peptidoglycan-associated lipoprotein
MQVAGLNLIAVLAATFMLAGCGSNTSKETSSGIGNRAAVEERGVADGAEDNAGGRTQGLEDDGAMSSAALNDPSSPLAVRVIYFDYDSANIRSDFADTVAAHATYLAINSDASVTLEGHADERGSREYNLALGENRALAVRRQLVLLGASASQIKTVSFGEERPALDNHAEHAYEQNRRVELVY